MTRKILPIVFVFCLVASFVKGQGHYKKCTVRTITYKEGKTDSMVSKIQYFDNLGRLTEELENQTNKKILYEYFKDSLLSKKITVDYDFGKDSVLQVYHYDSDNKLIEVNSATYGMSSISTCLGSIDNGVKWYDSLKTIFQYDKNGNLISELTYETGDNFHGGWPSTISKPNSTFYTYSSNKLSTITHSKITSLTELGLQFAEKYGFPDTTIVAMETHNYLDNCYTILLDERNTEAETGMSYYKQSIYLYDASGKIVHEYVDNPYLNHYPYYDQSEGPIERFYSYSPFKTLTKEIIYNSKGEQVMVVKYIYE